MAKRRKVFTMNRVNKSGLLCLFCIPMVCCSKLHPESICARDYGETLREMILLEATREIDRDMARNPSLDWDKVRSRLRALSTEDIFSFDLVTYKGFDKETKTTTCRSHVWIHLPARVKDQKFIEMSQIFQDLGAPDDLFGERPGVDITYTAQPTADDSGRYVISSGDIGPLAVSMLVLAGTDMLVAEQTSERIKRLEHEAAQAAQAAQEKVTPIWQWPRPAWQ